MTAMYGKQKIEEIEDFDDRNVIKIYKVGDYDRNWSSANYKEYFINKCAFKHEMLWALQATKLDFVKIAESYPVKLQMLAITAKEMITTYLTDGYMTCVVILYTTKQERNGTRYAQLYRNIQVTKHIVEFLCRSAGASG